MEGGGEEEKKKKQVSQNTYIDACFYNKWKTDNYAKQTKAASSLIQGDQNTDFIFILKTLSVYTGGFKCFPNVSRPNWTVWKRSQPYTARA